MKRTLYFTVSIAIFGLVLGVSSASHAQDGALKFENLRFEEDWSAYPENREAGFPDSLKKIQLTDTIWTSIGGELRARAEIWSNFEFSRANDEAFLLYRAFVHADTHFNEHWRVFSEIRYSGLTERDLPGGRRDKLDADYGDIWNFFVEAQYPIGELAATFRLGRQELQFGKERLISPLDWSNNRRIFSGGLVRLEDVQNAWTVDLFITAPVIIDRKSLNKNDRDHLFSGAYLTKKLSTDRIYGFDAYLLAYISDNGAAINEDRYTLGGRIWGGLVSNLNYDVEAAYQFGDLGTTDIRAYMFTADLTYTFSELTGVPWITAGFGYASGDNNAFDGKSETFDPLFPLGHAFLGYIDAVGRQNIVDIHATVGAWPIENKLRVRADFHRFWLAEKNDALYNAGGVPVQSGIGTENDVGIEIDLTALYKFGAHTSLLVGYGHFFAGDFIEISVPGKDIDFFFTQIGYTF